ncbi:MAG: cardiolipin synthase ClsB [Burkholderiaceae bacterium]|jgi:cardiolipin synthase|nr:cardiolipin synthase ClsB [Burkholderiaceae bacterium]
MTDPPPARLPGRLPRLAAPTVLHAGNRIGLLVNGEQYFPALLAAIENARRVIEIETYIFAEDNIGHRVADALAAAAGRGVEVRLLIDGFGGGEFARRLVGELGAHGVQVRIYRPERWWRLQRKLLRRLHRKIAVFDEQLALLGGINIIDDHNMPPHERARFGPRFDFAVACEGPIVGALALAVRTMWRRLVLLDLRRGNGPLPTLPPPRVPAPAGAVAASLVLRDNLRNRHAIERAYMQAFGAAQVRVLIANAYFLPGRRFRAALLAMARRGVRVQLLLQGQPEYALQFHAQRALYGQLLAGGIEIHEYVASYLHAKVAVVDRHWATVGSSNIDPYSLLLAREANVVVHDAGFAAQLGEALEGAIERDSRPVAPSDYASRGWIARARDWCAYFVVRLATVVLARGRDY